MNFSTTSKDWKKFELNNKTIALNVLYIPNNTKAISVANKSDYNNKRKKEVISLMISNGRKQLKLTYPNYFKEYHQIMKEIYIV